MSPVEFSSGTHGWIAGYSLQGCAKRKAAAKSRCPGALFVTSDRGRTWKRLLTVARSSRIDGFQFVGKGRGWVLVSACGRTRAGDVICGLSQSVLKTDDGGRHWSKAAWHIGHVNNFQWTTPTDGWASNGPAAGRSSCSGSLFRTADGGASWARILRLSGQCDLIPTMGPGGVGWVASTDAATCGAGGCPAEELRKTVDGGRSWQLIQASSTWTGTSGFLRSAADLDGAHGYLGFDLGTNLDTQGGIALTVDGGKTWKRSFPCYNVQAGGVAAPSTGTLWVAGSWVSYCSQPRGTGLFTSGDWGQHWTQVKAGG